MHLYTLTTYHVLVWRSFKYHSEENVSVAVSESSPPVSIGAQCSPYFGPVAAVQHLQPSQADDHRGAVTNDHSMTLSILKQLEQGREMQAELQEVIADLQVLANLTILIKMFNYATTTNNNKEFIKHHNAIRWLQRCWETGNWNS